MFACYLLNLPCVRDDTQQLKEMLVTHSIQLVSNILEEKEGNQSMPRKYNGLYRGAPSTRMDDLSVADSNVVEDTASSTFTR